jgi:hypothetical protein
MTLKRSPFPRDASSGDVRRHAPQARRRSAPRQRLRARGDAQPFEEDALRGQRLWAQPGRARDRFEIHMRGQVGLARGLQRVAPAHGPSHRLERVALRAPVAVVDDQRRAALAAIRRPRWRATIAACGQKLDEVALGGVGSRCASAGTGAGGASPKISSRRPSAPPSARASPPARWNCRMGSASKNSLATRKRGASGRQGRRNVVPGDIVAPERAPAPRAGRRGLDQQMRSGIETPARAGGAQRIGHQRAAPGAKLGQRDAGPARPGPSRPRQGTGPEARRTSG